MLLEKNDLKEIKKIVDASEQRLNKKIDSVDQKVDSVDKKVDSVDKKVDSVKNEIITVISREVNDLADINRAVINKMEELDYRLRIVERKLGFNAR